MTYVIMGVSGCGKTTVGKLVAQKLELPFYDADHFHPPENVKKMRSGFPLTDDDRRPWLAKLASQIVQWNKKKGAVLACSALKKTYRDELSHKGKEPVIFIYLKGSKSQICSRLTFRDGHFMPSTLLDSQFADLEEPSEALTISIEKPPDEMAEEIFTRLSST